MNDEILVNVSPQEVRIALLENGVLQEVHIERNFQHGLIGNIYKGKVNRLLPGIESAFVDIGLDRSAFLHVSDVLGYEQAIKSQGKADIRQLLRQGQELLVQVYKDQLGSKGARLTMQLTIPSRYLVYTPGTKQISVSQKITDENERQRLINMITPTEVGGYIFRTVAEGVAQQEIDADKVFLAAMWEDLQEKCRKTKVGEVIYQDIPIVLRVLRDLVGMHVEKIRVDHLMITNEMKAFAKCYAPALLNRIEYYDGPQPIFDIYSVEDELQRALQRKVYLKSGGHLVFDQTEAMVTIDVNTGAYLGAGSLEQTTFKTNLEAVDAIARQIRLRNLGGIIIIDFIDMTESHHREHILQSLAKALAKDSARTQISELSSLGLVQLTRKRSRESLERTLCVSCPLCHRKGSVKSVETMCYEIFRELKRVTKIYPWSGFLVIASERIVAYLQDEESTTLADLEMQLNKPIKLQKEITFTQERYNILPLAERE